MAENTNPRFFDLVGNVRAMRRLKPDPVPMELIWKVLNAGVQAPSGQNTQPWRFVLVSDPTRKKWFADRYKRAIEKRSTLARGLPSRKKTPGSQSTALYYQIDHMHEVPYLLFVCGKCDWPFKVPERERIGEGPPNYGAVYPCVQNILLACRALGLGAARNGGIGGGGDLVQQGMAHAAAAPQYADVQSRHGPLPVIANPSGRPRIP